jgi:tripartite-type tricarboxylate transporter receptor subunit TctC
VPFALDLAKDNDTRLALQLLFAGQAIGRPFIAPPDLAPNILSNLRKGFNATMEDPEFLADARNQKLTPHPGTGEYLQSIIAIIYSTPKPIVERMGKLMK